MQPRYKCGVRFIYGEQQPLQAYESKGWYMGISFLWLDLWIKESCKVGFKMLLNGNSRDSV